MIKLRNPGQVTDPALVERLLRQLVYLTGSSDPEVADAATCAVLGHLLSGEVIVDPPLSSTDQRTLRGIIEKALIHKRH